MQRVSYVICPCFVLVIQLWSDTCIVVSCYNNVVTKTGKGGLLQVSNFIF